MTNYFVNENGERTIIADELFDVLWHSIDEDDIVSSKTSVPVPDDVKRMKKKKYNDTLNRKYKESGYFQAYYKENDKPFECDKCGCKLNSSTNRARHQKSQKCKVKEEETKQKQLEDLIIKRVIGIPT